MKATFLFLVFSLHVLNVFECEALSDNDRFDCYPEGEVTEAKCSERKCSWQVKPHGAKKEMPECFYNQSMNYGYEVPNGSKDTVTKNGFIVNLTRSNTLPTGTGIFANPIRDASVTITRHTRAQLRVTIRDAKKQRYEVLAGSKFFIPNNPNAPSSLYKVVQNNTNGFSFSVTRPDENGKSIFDTSVGAMVLSDQYLQISAKLDSSFCYGFGEHEHESFVLNFNWTKLGMFSRDQPPSKGANLYGVHPFYMCIENSGKAHGVLLLNSNAMDITLQPTPAITFRTIGGVLDFFFFLGPTPADVIEQYTGLIGRPFMPPYWSLGFQLCRYGYNSLDVVKKTVARMTKYDIPQDVQYGDIDYMDRQLDFTINNKTYNGLPEYVRELKKDGIRYISILDPAISANETTGKYPPYDLGNKMNIWIKDHTGTNVLFGKVWPDLPNITVNETKDWAYQTKHYRAHAVFPDFTHPNISSYWGKLIVDFHKTIEFDGIWIDMNEPASFVQGSVNGCPANNSLEKPAYKPGIWGNTLADKTICMSAKHWNGEVEYNLHSLFGWSQTKPTYDATMKATGKRPVVISRSTYPSSGKYTGHWLGDNYSGWSQMKTSIIGMLEFGFFGIPYIGADICGFFKNTEEDLCQKWMALGAFYPFSRNHNGKGYMEQDPAVFGEKFAKKARSILRTRYNLLPYLYTIFHEAHKTGGPVVRPLFYEFFVDKQTCTIDDQFMWGNALLITPILRKDQNTSLTAYIPNARWFDYFTGAELEQSSRGKKATFKVNNNTQIFLHVRGGTIMPTQDPANNTMFSRRNPMGLIVALNEKSKASGILYWDDGESSDSMTKNQYQMLDFSADKSSLKISLRTNGYKEAGKFNFEHITVYGVKENRGKNFNYITNNDGAVEEAKAKLSDTGVLTVTGLKLPLNKAHNIKWYLEKPDTHGGSSSMHGNLAFILICFSVALAFNQMQKA